VCAGVFAAVTLSVHVKYTRDQWSSWSNYLRLLMLVGCLGQLAGVCGFAVYLALAISQHQGSLVANLTQPGTSGVETGGSVKLGPRAPEGPELR